ncbi:MAG: hypothetical protein VX834_12760 [Myxococcota bacterium]|nr:hypothetical protein [Myxococcota bacterium]
MAARFFGQYLIEAGAISAAQLREALDLIESDYEKIGELAVKHGYLAKDDVNRLHREQRYIDSPLGQLAIERGLMTDEQLNKLLTIQQDTRLRIGDALVRLGYVAEDAIEKHFQAFKFDQDTTLGRTQRLPLDLAENRLAEFIVGFFPKITLRMCDVRLKVVQGCEAAERHFREHSASVRVDGDETVLVTLSVDEDFGEAIMWGLLGGSIAPEDEKPSYEDVLGEFISIVAGNALMALQEEGIKGRIECPEFGRPTLSSTSAFVLVCTVGGGTLMLTRLDP